MTGKNTKQTTTEAANRASESDSSDKGLHAKYDVRSDGKHITDCFVLRPETDEAAQAALRVYADHTTNEELSADLTEWLEQIEEDDTTPE